MLILNSQAVEAVRLAAFPQSLLLVPETMQDKNPCKAQHLHLQLPSVSLQGQCSLHACSQPRCHALVQPVHGRQLHVNGT